MKFMRSLTEVFVVVGFVGLGGLTSAPMVGSVQADESEAQRRVPLEVGQPAPDFKLPASTGEEVSLSSYRGKNSVVLYFYPKDNTPGCTKEAQDLRDDYERFKKAGAVVLGVSVDDLNSHKGFANKNNLNFPILVDLGGIVARQYGAMGWIMAKRVTYVVGRDGLVKHVDADVDAHLATHSKSLLRVVQDLGSAVGPKKSMKSKVKPAPR